LFDFLLLFVVKKLVKFEAETPVCPSKNGTVVAPCWQKHQIGATTISQMTIFRVTPIHNSNTVKETDCEEHSSLLRLGKLWKIVISLVVIWCIAIAPMQYIFN
jgi:hypothetical protein